MKYTDVLELIDNGGNPPAAAVFMTYGFDARFFESHVLPTLLGVSSADSDNELLFRYQVAESLQRVPVAVLSDFSQYHGGRTFIYDHASIDGVTFHPKCFLLLYPDFLRIIVGSCNLTRSGFCSNAELIWHQDVRKEENTGLGSDIHRILVSLAGQFHLENYAAVKSIIDFTAQFDKNSDFPRLIATTDSMSPMDNILSNINGTVKGVTILSPFFEGDRETAFESSMVISFLKKLCQNNKGVRIKICFPAKYQENSGKYTVSVPVNLFAQLEKSGVNIKYFIVPADWETENGEMVNRVLHGKLIWIEFAGGCNLYLAGSINFTKRAMTSAADSLKNVEIGVMEKSRAKFLLPDCRKVTLNQLEILEQPEKFNDIICFIDAAYLEAIEGKYRLTIKIYKNKAVYPFDIYYAEKLINTFHMSDSEVIIKDFRLKREQDIKIKYQDLEFYVPIFILNKAEVVTDDTAIDFSIGIGDILDFYAGKYRSLVELVRLKQLSAGPESQSNMEIMSFRHNLNRFFKAAAAIKEGLEKPFYSEYSFSNYLHQPMGIIKLIDMLADEYMSGAAGKQESFFFLTELLYMLTTLNYSKDWISDKVKTEMLAGTKQKALMIIKEITRSAKGRVRKQYLLIAEDYGLEI